MDTQLTIQHVAASTGLSPHTLRYYERIGLIHDVARDAGGRRRYTPADMDWLRFLMRLRETGMSIADMLHYAELRRQGTSTHAERGLMMETHLARVEAEIAHLQELASFVADKVRWYRDTARISTPPATMETEHADSGKHPLPDRTRKTRRG
ncbi:MerR family transcriptional regulator [Uliginosibacterium sp. 31-16]|uniref:MerR family transcriptional regulator n=1 Tax=Uliginosibacterium sp. 31-16 TaxID=3068315 RepID=UPI00273EC6AF|nr:MerR family transcriptional regulator [Uliginosibacterium sp. 31-16]MDP5239246.1 MerR family transcriptional regulator [Uliginosibacterium sp. 31-16]